MKIIINNFCQIKRAEIEISGLTVMTGENDSGKSSIGKLLYSLINANIFTGDDVIDKKGDIYDALEELYFYLRSKNAFFGDERCRQAFLPKRLMIELDKYIDFNDSNSIEELLVNKITRNIRTNGTIDLKVIKTLISDIVEAVNYKNNYYDVCKCKIKKLLHSEFKSEITNKYNNDITNVEVYDGYDKLINLIIEKNRIKEYSINDILNVRDVTYIETPLILQMYELIKNSYTLRMFGDKVTRKQTNFLPNHIMDLVEKMENSKFYKDNMIYDEEYNLKDKHFSKIINDIVHGDMTFDREKDNFSFSKMGKEFKPLNIASGIKSFGILELLLNAGYLKKNNLLIIDEPEIHLHPEWQIRYAHLICLLVESGLKVLINTHSPYMLQAFDYFSNNLKNDDLFKVYQANKNEKGYVSTFEDVTNCINKAFMKLSAPFQKIMWGR